MSLLQMRDQPLSGSSIYVLGVRVDRLSQQQTVEAIDQMVARQQESNDPLPCQQVVTVNPEFVMEAQRNTLFRACINQAALVVADGMGIVWATRILGASTPERVTGTDTLPELAKRCAVRG